MTESHKEMTKGTDLDDRENKNGAGRDVESGEKTWWKEFYDTSFETLKLNRSPDLLSKIADFLISKLRLENGGVLFDQCCGNGEIATELGKRGFETYGIDQSASYIEAARKKSKNLPQCRFFVGDAFSFSPFSNGLLADGAFNWFTSFGYVDDDATNLKMIEMVSASLKPGGRFVLDFVNADFIVKNFREKITYELPGRDDGAPFMIERFSELTCDGRGLTQTWLYHHNNAAQRKIVTYVRLYRNDDLDQLLDKAGLAIKECCGDVEGTAFDSARSERLIVVAEKAK